MPDKPDVNGIAVDKVAGSDHIKIVKQLSVFMENKPGQLRDAVTLLSDAGINLRALSIAEIEQYGILRVLTDNTPRAAQILRDAGVSCTVSDVIGVEAPDKPGGLAELLQALGDEVSVDYMYAELQGRGDRALLVMKLDPQDRALELLRDSGLY